VRELQSWAYQHVGNTAAEDELWDIVGRMIAAERESCEKLLDERARTYHETALQWQKRAGERADDDARRMGIEYAIRHAVAAENAAAIRARGETPDKTT
jgi:hypothetical protein